MQRRTREIIALAILAVLVVGFAVLAAWYLFVGHGWNEAATDIDDRIGSMDRYTVVLYEGIIPEGYLNYSKEAAGSKDADKADDTAANGEEAEAGDSDEAEAGPPTLGEVAASYRDKSAQIIVLGLDESERYSDCVITVKNGCRIAIYSVSGPRPDHAARIMEKQLDAQGVDFSICIIDDLRALKRGIGDANVAICTDPAFAGAGGRWVGTTFAVGSPARGQVGAVVIAPSGFLSAKTVTEL